MTIISACGVGFPKECYEPVFGEILARCNSDNLNIRDIWIADSAGMGQSSVLNLGNVGNKVSWWDHSRDLLHLINTFHAEMPRPLIGLGHSMGAAQIAYLSTLHPSLFTSLILIEPPVYPEMLPKVSLAQMRGMLRRREEWPDRSAAEKAIRKSPYYGRWDPRVLERYLKHGLREVRFSQSTNSQQDGSPVRTVAYKELEVAHIMRLNDRGVGLNSGENVTHEDRRYVPDLDIATAIQSTPLYAPWPRQMFFLLPQLRHWVLYTDGDKSPRTTPEITKARLETTGTGQGGSGGKRVGTVKHVLIKGGQHTIPLDEHLGQVAEAAGQFIVDEMKRFQESRPANDLGYDGEADEPPRMNPKMLHVIAKYEEEKERIEKAML